MHLCIIHPWKPTWNPKIMVLNMSVLFNGTIFRFHVHFQGCIFPELIFLFQKTHKPCIQFDEASSKFLCHRLRYASVTRPKTAILSAPLAPPNLTCGTQIIQLLFYVTSRHLQKEVSIPCFSHKKKLPNSKSSWINKKTASNLQLLATI